MIATTLISSTTHDEDNKNNNSRKAAPVMNADDFTGSLNAFPVDAFPSPFKELITDCERTLNFPPDYTATSILAAVSTSIGKSAKLKVKNAWYEYPVFYLALVGDAGANKSHPMELAFKPFEDIDRRKNDSYRLKYESYEAFQSLPKKEKEGREAPQKPTLTKTILHNFTAEILHQRMSDNLRGCAIVSDELATHLEGMNNYSKGDQTSTYLSFWSCKATSIDRVSRPFPLWLPEPFLNIIGSLQPRVLPKLFPAGKTDNGFVQRFLFAFPVDAKKQPINDHELNERLIADYSRWIQACIKGNPVIMDKETGKSKPVIYHWADDAKTFFYQWQEANTESVNGDAGSLYGEILSKYDIHFARLALVMQIMMGGKNNLISLAAAQAAAKLCAYYQQCSERVVRLLSNANPLSSLPQNKLSFYRALPDSFSTGEATQTGEAHGLNNRAVFRFLNNEDLFTKQAYGQYFKKQKK